MALLLLVVNGLWLVQISLPLLDGRVPSLLALPISQLLCLPLGALLVLAVQGLLPGNRRAGCRKGENGSLDLLTNVLFVFLSGLWSGGLGMHASTVVVESHLSGPDHPLDSLVHEHLHEFWAHNIFQSGYFGLLLLLSWTDSRKNADTTVTTEDTAEDTMQSCALDNFYCLWPCMMGFAYSIVAIETHTVPLTTIFYVSSIFIGVRFRVIHSTLEPNRVLLTVTMSSIAGILFTGMFALLFTL